jgi:hypothetical protein
MIWRYRVEGTVREEESGEPLAGLLVKGFDKDLIFDDPLGETRTDDQGRFEIRFTEDAFRSVVDENPDLYLLIFDAAGARELHSTKDRIRRSAGAEEHYEILIPRSTLASREETR